MSGSTPRAGRAKIFLRLIIAHSVTRSLVVTAACVCVCVCVTGQVKPRPSEVIACVCVCVLSERGNSELVIS